MWGTNAAYVLVTVLLLLGILRAFQLARGFPTSLYRHRAYWMAGLMIMLALGNLGSVGGVGNDFISFILGLIGEFAFIGALLISLVFVDQNILVTREIDFFHRDTLRWSSVRKPAYVAVIAASLVLGVASVLTSNNGGNPNQNLLIVIGVLTYFPVIGVALGYAAVTLLISARRTPDRATRRFAGLLGAALALGVIASTIWLPLSFVVPTDVENFSSSLFEVASSYVLYLAVMSLSPLGRVRKEEMATPAASQVATVTVRVFQEDTNNQPRAVSPSK